MAFTLAQLTGLENSIASGSLTVKYDGKEVTYRSMADLIAARNLIKGDLTTQGVITVDPRSNRGPASLTIFSRD